MELQRGQTVHRLLQLLGVPASSRLLHTFQPGTTRGLLGTVLQERRAAQDHSQARSRHRGGTGRAPDVAHRLEVLHASRLAGSHDGIGWRGLVDGRGTTGMGSRGGPKRVRARRPRSEHIRRARRFCGRFGRVAFGCQPAGQVIARREAGVGVPHDRGSRVGVAVETVQRRAFAGLAVRTAGSCSCPAPAAGHRRWGRVVDRASVKPNGSGCRIGMWVKSSAAWRRCGGLTGRDALRAAPARSAGRCSGGAAGCVGCRSGGAPAQRCTRRSCRPAPGCAQRAWRGPTGRRSRQSWAVRLPQRDASPR